MNWMEQVTPAPPDPILGLTEAFKKDSNPAKVNLGVGVFVDDYGQTPVLDSVKKAEHMLWENQTTKSYMPIVGAPEYGTLVQELTLGAGHAVLKEARVHTAHTPGGTGALRVGAELIRSFGRDLRVWLSAPTWPNHKGVFSEAGLHLREYAYYDPKTKGVDFAAMMEHLEKVPAGDVVLLHVCCHNPTGADLSASQWHQVAEVAARRGWFPFFDFAYQGFGDSLDQDRTGLLAVLEKVPACLVSSSFSKNFGLYQERVGALSVIAPSREKADAVFSQAKRLIRTIYSNPPGHGGQIVMCILRDKALSAQWRAELQAMCARIANLRRTLAEALQRRHTGTDFSFIPHQKGMFSFSGLTDNQVQFLREKKSVYMVGGGRINVAGILPSNLDYVCDSIAEAIHAHPFPA